MSRSQAIRSGVTAVIRQPLIMLAELAWRWTLAAAILVLGAYSLLLFLHSLPVTDRDMFGLSGVIPSLFWRTIAHIFSGSGPKMIRIAVILAIGYSGLWWLAASFGRAATLRALANQSAIATNDAELKSLRPLCLRTIFGFNALRVLLGIISALAYLAAFLLTFSLSGMRTDAATSSTAVKFYLLFVPLAIIIGSVWSMLNWYLSLAPVVAAGTAADSSSSADDSRSALSNFFASAMLSRRRTLQFAWVGFVFGILRLLLYAATWFMFLAIAGLLAQMPGGVIWGVLFLLALVYSFISTVLNLVRLAAYLRIVEWDAELLAAPPSSPIAESPTAVPPTATENEYSSLPQFPAEPPPEPAG